MTLDRIVRRNAVRFPERPALVAGDSIRTWSALDARVDRAPRRSRRPAFAPVIASRS